MSTLLAPIEIVKFLLLVVLGVAIFELIGREHRFFRWFLGWFVWCWLFRLIFSGDIFSPFSTVMDYVKGLFAALVAAGGAGAAAVLMSRIFKR